MTTATATYRIVPAPKFSGMIDFDCAICEYETLKRPVFLVGPAGVFAAGTGCAAKLLYGDDSARSKRLVTNAFESETIKARQADELIAERKARYTLALAEFTADKSGYSPALESCRTTYWSCKRALGLDLEAAPLNFPEFMAAVAETGEIPNMEGT